MRRLFNIGSFIFLGIFTPLTLLILLSQNALPGDLFYPVKRGLEGSVLIAASVNPTTRAMFSSNLADRRFDETQKVILAKGDTSGLSEFVFTVSKAAEEINQVQDEKTKSDLQQNFVSSLDIYQQKIERIRTQIVYVPVVQEREVVRVVQVPTSSQPSPTPIQSGPTNTPVPRPTTPPGASPFPTNTPVPLPTNTPTPTLTPSPTSPPSTGGDLNDVEAYIKCLKQHPNNPGACSIPPSLRRQKEQHQEVRKEEKKDGRNQDSNGNNVEKKSDSQQREGK